MLGRSGMIRGPAQPMGGAFACQDRHMDDVVVWIIIAGFYAPLHFLVPLLVLFITGTEEEATRGRLMRAAARDSALSMLAAFAVVILLANIGRISLAMLVLLLSMLYPFIGIWRHRREISTP